METVVEANKENYYLALRRTQQLIRTEAQWQALIAFFRVRCGVAVRFRFKDWSDYKAVSQPLKDLRGNEYQLVKQYVSGSAVYEREITKPGAGSVKLYANSILQASGWS